MFKVLPGQLVSFTRDTILLTAKPSIISRGSTFSNRPHLSESDYGIVIEDAEMWILPYSHRRLQVLTKFGIGYVDETVLQVA